MCFGLASFWGSFVASRNYVQQLNKFEQDCNIYVERKLEREETANQHTTLFTTQSNSSFYGKHFESFPFLWEKKSRVKKKWEHHLDP